MGILDTKLAQGASMFFALIVVKLIPQIMDANIFWFILLTILCAVRPVYTFFLKKDD
jgi:hypothetical protein